jgi:hypothetical protein
MPRIRAEYKHRHMHIGSRNRSSKGLYNEVNRAPERDFDALIRSEAE